MKQPRICFILRGYPASGKSTLAKELSAKHDAPICSADTYFMENGKYNFDKTKLFAAHNACMSWFKTAVKNGKNVIVDNTNLKYRDMKQYIDYLVLNNNQNEFIYSVELIEVAYNDIEKAIEIRSNAEKCIPEDKMRQMFKDFKRDVKGLMYMDYKGKISLGSLDSVETTLPFPENTENKKEIVICDLDGTASIFQFINGITLRDAFDATKSNADIINHPVAQALKGFQSIGHEIIFLSGREDKYRQPTEEFLERMCDKYGIVYSELYMRASGDFRPDNIIKQEIYDNKIKEKYFVTAIFDDRPKVIRMWRSLGLFVFDCNYRGVEF